MSLVVRRVATSDLAPADAETIRALLWAAFTGDDGMTEDDWLHALGGIHVVAEDDGAIVGHASVVARALEVGGVPLRTGYVEAVATAPDRQRAGIGTRVMAAVADIVREGYEIGALGTGSQAFYERLGWQVWRGPSGVRLPDGRIERTRDEDGYILVLRTPTTPELDPTALITCEWRPGDAW